MICSILQNLSHVSSQGGFARCYEMCELDSQGNSLRSCAGKIIAKSSLTKARSVQKVRQPYHLSFIFNEIENFIPSNFIHLSWGPKLVSTRVFITSTLFTLIDLLRMTRMSTYFWRCATTRYSSSHMIQFEIILIIDHLEYDGTFEETETTYGIWGSLLSAPDHWCRQVYA